MFEYCATSGADSWVNCKDYTPFQLFLFCGGCWLWVVAYFLIIRSARKYQFLEMPMIAGAANLGWETAYGLYWGTNMGKLALYAYKAWLLVDVAIVYYLYKYGDKQGWSPQMRRNFKPMLVLWSFLFFALFGTYPLDHNDHRIGAITAYADNLIISFTYIYMLGRLTDVRGLSTWVAWLKGIGTGMNTIFMFRQFPEDLFLHILGVTIAVGDATYIYMLYQRRKWQRENPEPHVPQLDAPGAVGYPIGTGEIRVMNIGEG